MLSFVLNFDSPLTTLQPEAFDALISFDYPPVAAVTIAYPDSAIRDDRLDDDGQLPGFGQLHPRSQVGCFKGLSQISQSLSFLGTVDSPECNPEQQGSHRWQKICRICAVCIRCAQDPYIHQMVHITKTVEFGFAC